MKTISMKAIAGLMFLCWTNLLAAQNSLENIPASITKLEIGNMIRAEINDPAEGKKGYEATAAKNQLKVSFNGNTMKVESNGAGEIPRLTIYHQFNEIETKDIAQVTLNKVNNEVLTVTALDNSQVSGSGDFTTLNLICKGASLIKLQGKAKTLDVSTRDAANVDADELVAEMAVVNTTDVSTARVQATKSLVANALQLSRIIYTGEPSDAVVLNAKDFARIREASDSEDGVITGGAQDTTRIRFGDKKLIIINDDDKKVSKPEEKKRKQGKQDMKNVWAGFELGMSSFVTPELAFKQDEKFSFMENNVGKSWFWGLNILETDIHLVKNKLALTTGFGMNWANYRFGNTAHLVPDVDTLIATTVNDKLSNNRLRVFSLDVPLMLKLAPRKKGPHLAAGVIFSYSPGVKLITESESKGYKEVIKMKDDFNVNPFRATATVRVGYGWLRVFANYSLTPYFNKEAGPDIRNFQAGLTLIPF